jgi:hypothetical protein
VKDFSKIIENYFKHTVYLDNCSSWYRSDGGSGDRITGLWPGSALHAMETFRSPRWEDFGCIYMAEEDEEDSNHLGWLGNGWSILQTDDSEGELVHLYGRI